MNQDIQTSSRTAAARQQAEQQQQPAVVPPVDVFEDASGITLLADLPGVPKDGLDLRVDGDTLLIEGTAATHGPRDMELVYGEAQVPCYRRRFTLSRELDTSRIDAQLKDGVLRVTIPRSEEAKPRKIAIAAG